MSEERPGPDGAAAVSPPGRLTYGTGAVARTSVLAWVGLGFALLGALVAATQVMIVVREARTQTRFQWVGPAQHLVLPLLGVVLAGFGWRRRARRWPAVAITVAVMTVLVLLLLGSRTWGTRPGAGESAWHRPQFQWGAEREAAGA
jgi:hypothetical protein